MRFRKLHPPAGARPGTLLIPKDAHFPRVRLIRYNESVIEDREVDDVDTVSLDGWRIQELDRRPGAWEGEKTRRSGSSEWADR